MPLGFHNACCKMFYFDFNSPKQCLLDFMKHIARWSTLFIIPHTMSHGFHKAYCKMVDLDSQRPCNVSWTALCTLHDGRLLKKHTMLNDNMINIARWITLILKDHTMSHRFHCAYCKMVFFGSHTLYTVSWI